MILKVGSMVNQLVMNVSGLRKKSSLLGKGVLDWIIYPRSKGNHNGTCLIPKYGVLLALHIYILIALLYCADLTSK
jgi:hypothetical protein